MEKYLGAMVSHEVYVQNLIKNCQLPENLLDRPESTFRVDLSLGGSILST